MADSFHNALFESVRLGIDSFPLVTRQDAGPTPDYSNRGMQPSIIAWSIILSILSFSITLARCYTRIRYAKFELEDAFAVFAWILCFLTTLALCILTRAGIGRDAWNVPPWEGSRGGMLSLVIYLGSSAHYVGMTIIKLSIVLFYRRVFPSPRFRIACYAVGAFTLAAGISVFCANTFQCEVVGDVIRNAEFRRGKCREGNPIYQSGAVILTFGDLLVLGLPLPVIFKSMMGTQKKIQVATILLVGLLATAASVVRIYYTFVAPKIGANYSKIIAFMMVTAMIEIQLAILCASAPALKGLIRRKLADSRENSRMTGMSGSGTDRSGSIPQKKLNSRSGMVSLGDESEENLAPYSNVELKHYDDRKTDV